MDGAVGRGHTLVEEENDARGEPPTGRLGPATAALPFETMPAVVDCRGETGECGSVMMEERLGSASAFCAVEEEVVDRVSRITRCNTPTTGWRSSAPLAS